MSPKMPNGQHASDALSGGYPGGHRKYERRDLVLAKVDLLPFIPGMILDTEDVPPRIGKMRPKENQDNTYAVQLFPKGDYYWVAETKLERLSNEQINAFIAGTPDRGMDRRLYGVGNRRMLKAYVAASEPDAWEDRLSSATNKLHAGHVSPTTVTNKLQPAAENDMEQDRAAIASATAGSSPPMHCGPHPDSDANDSEDEQTVVSMLRVVPAEVDALTEKRKLELAKDPEAVRVRRWRHELQHTLLRKEDAGPSAMYTARLASPDEQAMIRLNNVLAQIEAYEHMTVEYLVFSKILKIVRWIHMLGPLRIHGSEGLQVHERMGALATKWVEMCRGGTEIPVRAVNK
ncbi:hypothetical protein C8F01DRAFT_1121370 [Mycena amicta]|nr:hypothetical protein C8F01DRAFT_1121370 [Mycena amicta]